MQEFTEATWCKRVDRVMFSDEKLFCTERCYNAENEVDCPRTKEGMKRIREKSGKMHKGLQIK